MTLDPEQVTGTDADEGTNPTPSKLDELRAAFRQQVANPRLFKRLPAAGGRLAAEYRVLTAKETTEALQAIDDGAGLLSGSDAAQNADTLIRALVAIHVHDPDHPNANHRGVVEMQRWLDADVGGPLRFDKRLLDAVGIELADTSARAIALRLFDGNEIAMGTQAAQLMAWMTDTTSEALQDFGAGS